MGVEIVKKSVVERFANTVKAFVSGKGGKPAGISQRCDIAGKDECVRNCGTCRLVGIGSAKLVTLFQDAKMSRDSSTHVYTPHLGKATSVFYLSGQDLKTHAVELSATGAPDGDWRPRVGSAGQISITVK